MVRGGVCGLPLLLIRLHEAFGRYVYFVSPVAGAFFSRFFRVLLLVLLRFLCFDCIFVPFFCQEKKVVGQLSLRCRIVAPLWQ